MWCGCSPVLSKVSCTSSPAVRGAAVSNAYSDAVMVPLVDASVPVPSPVISNSV